ncbi:MAG: hypothetical protein ABI723_20645 [Bacteroidia bacterium]
MGRNTNIKRAKLLKEAKRKREQDDLLALGLGPASIAIRKKAAERGEETVINQGKIKYSELLTRLVKPTLKDGDDISLMKTKYMFGALAWNSAIVKERSEELFQKAKNEMRKMTDEIPEAANLFEEMVKRKQDEFAEYKNIITDIEIKKLQGLDYDLSVATTPLKD